MAHSFGDVVLVPFPFTDQSSATKRPAVIVSSRDYHAGRHGLIIMAITSQVRKAAGFTQVERAAELGISQRMMAYCESPTATSPANLLPSIATVLGVSIDDLFGRAAKRRLVKQEGDSRLRRRLFAIEKLEVTGKRQVLQLLDAFIERGQLKRKVHAAAGQ